MSGPTWRRLAIWLRAARGLCFNVWPRLHDDVHCSAGDAGRQTVFTERQLPGWSWALNLSGMSLASPPSLSAFLLAGRFKLRPPPRPVPGPAGTPRWLLAFPGRVAAHALCESPRRKGQGGKRVTPSGGIRAAGAGPGGAPQPAKGGSALQDSFRLRPASWASGSSLVIMPGVSPAARGGAGGGSQQALRGPRGPHPLMDAPRWLVCAPRWPRPGPQPGAERARIRSAEPTRQAQQLAPAKPQLCRLGEALPAKPRVFDGLCLRGRGPAPRHRAPRWSRSPQQPGA